MQVQLASILLTSILGNNNLPQTYQSIQIAPIVDNTIEIDLSNIDHETTQIDIEIEEDKNKDDGIFTEFVLTVITAREEILRESIMKMLRFQEKTKKLKEQMKMTRFRHQDKKDISKAEKLNLKPLRFG